MPTKNLATRNKMVDDWTSTWDNGTISIYKTIDSRLLVEFPLGAQAFNAASNGVASLHNDSKSTVNAVGTSSDSPGTQIHGMLRSASPGEYELAEIGCHTDPDYPLIISNLNIETGQPISLLALTYKEPEGVKAPA